MEQLYRQSSYFSMRQNQRVREQQLEKLLRERLPSSDLGEALFELLAIRRESAKESLTKEGGDRERGKAIALKELLDLFEPGVPKK